MRDGIAKYYLNLLLSAQKDMRRERFTFNIMTKTQKYIESLHYMIYIASPQSNFLSGESKENHPGDHCVLQLFLFIAKHKQEIKMFSAAY